MEAINNEEIIAYPNNSTIISTEKLFQQILNETIKKSKKSCKFKITQSEIPFMNNLVCCDLKIGMKFKEDEILEGDPKILYNLRRGYSLIMYKETLNNCISNIEKHQEIPKFSQSINDVNNFCIISRKGVHKFFDMKSEFFYEGPKEKSFYYCLDIALKALEKEYSVQIISTRKANGENVQISYCSQIESWIISSKNVSLAARKEEDLKLYEDGQDCGRYSFALLIAKVWFNELKRFSSDNLILLRKEMTGKTWIGEYTGHPKHQHLVMYPKIGIMFYSIVENDSPIDCQFPYKSLEVFNKYGFQVVKMSNEGIFNKKEKFIECLKQIYFRLALSNIMDEEEGLVLYIAKFRQNTEPIICSLSKVKTLEYRLYRKLREQLKNYCSLEKKKANKPIPDKAQVINKYIDDSLKLMKSTLGLVLKNEKIEMELEKTLPLPLRYYKEIAEKAFKEVEKRKKDETLLSEIGDGYTSFLQKLQNDLHIDYFIEILSQCKPKFLLIYPPLLILDKLFQTEYKDGKIIYFEEYLKNKKCDSKSVCIISRSIQLIGKKPNDLKIIICGFGKQEELNYINYVKSLKYIENAEESYSKIINLEEYQIINYFRNGNKSLTEFDQNYNGSDILKLPLNPEGIKQCIDTVKACCK